MFCIRELEIVYTTFDYETIISKNCFNNLWLWKMCEYEIISGYDYFVKIIKYVNLYTTSNYELFFM